jgi:hypothetical protein
LTVKVSLPTGARTCALQTVVQLTMVGVPALPPLGVTAIDADLVEVEIYAGRRAVLDGDRTVIWNWTSAVFCDRD